MIYLTDLTINLSNSIKVKWYQFSYIFVKQGHALKNFNKN